MGVTEEAGKVATTTVEAMKSVPLAIALLAVNLAFIGFNGFILKEVSNNAAARDKTETELIATLVKQIGDCRQNPRPQNETKSPLFLPPVHAND